MVETAVAAKAAVERVAAVPAAERAAVARVAAMGAGGTAVAAGVVAMAEGATVLAATEAVATVAAAMENRRASTRESLQG